MEPRSDPGGAKSDPGGPTMGRRAAQEAEKDSKRASCFEVAFREAPGVDVGASAGRFGTLRESIVKPLRVDVSQSLKHPKTKISG